MKQKIKFLLATIMMLAGTMVSQAQTETLLITINSTSSFTSGNRTFNNIATVTFSSEVECDDDDDGWYNTAGSNIILSVTPAAGYTITKVKFYCSSGSAVRDIRAFKVENWSDFTQIVKVDD